MLHPVSPLSPTGTPESGWQGIPPNHGTTNLLFLNGCRGGRADPARNSGISPSRGTRGPERQKGRARPLAAGGFPAVSPAGPRAGSDFVGVPAAVVPPIAGGLKVRISTWLIAGLSQTSAAAWLTLRQGLHLPIPEILHLQNEDNNRTHSKLFREIIMVPGTK